MANPQPNTENLKKFESRWIKVNGQPRDTQQIRIPKDLFDEVLAFAKQKDIEKHGCHSN